MPGRLLGRLEGEVIGRTYLGTTLRYRVRCGTDTLIVDDHDPAGKALLGGHVALVFDPARLRIWPAAGALVQAEHRPLKEAGGGSTG